MKFNNKLEVWIFHQHRLINAIKTTLALSIGLYCMLVLKIPHSAWMLVTSSVVMIGLPQVGSALNKAEQRITGTFIAAIISYIVLYLFHGSPLSVAITILAGNFIFSYFATGSKFNYATTLAGVSLSIMLGYGSPSFAEASWRLGNIIAGAVVAMIVNAFIFPIKAKRKLALNISVNLRDLAYFYSLDDCPPEYAKTILAAAYQNLALQSQLLKESIHESNHIRQHQKEYRQIISLQRSITSVLELLFKAHWDVQAQTPEHNVLFQQQLNTAILKLSRAITYEAPVNTNEVMLPIKKTAANITEINTTWSVQNSAYLWLHLQLESLFSELTYYINAVARCQLNTETQEKH